MTGRVGARSGRSVSIRLAVIVLAGNLSLGALTSAQVRYDHEHFWSAPSAFAGGSNAHLILHVVAPQATDPQIDRALDDHYAWLDTSAPINEQLFVYLPGTDGVPANAQLWQQLAARLGYHVIGLNYPNSVGIAAACTDDPDPNACSYSARFEIVYGNDSGVDSPIVDVSRPNSIYNRLTKVLHYLAAHYPEEGWSEFLTDGKPRWDRIALSGISQGGGEAAMIAKFHIVARVVMASSVPDRAAAGWESTHVTPSERYWGLAHDQDPMYGRFLVSWKAFGMDAFGDQVQVETSVPPYGCTHMLFTDLKPQRGGYKFAHASTVIDIYTPLDKDRTPALVDAWRYMMSAEPNCE